MSIKGKRMIVGLGIFIVLIMLFIAIMTWFYPFSPFSIHQSYIYKPGEVLYGHDKTYKDILNEFKKSYEKDLNDDLKSNDTNFTVDRTQYILPIFEQD